VLNVVISAVTCLITIVLSLESWLASSAALISAALDILRVIGIDRKSEGEAAGRPRRATSGRMARMLGGWGKG